MKPPVSKIDTHNLRWAFWGTDELAVCFLDKLKTLKLLPTLIITTPDRPQGRSLTLTPSPIKIWALKEKIPLVQPVSLKDDQDFLRQSWELFVVASYGKIIPETILAIPTQGAINIHPSLLPRYRGATPLENTILNGDEETGVTLMLMDKEMDHGPIIAQERVSLADRRPTYDELRQELAERGANLFYHTLANWLNRTLLATPQDHSEASYTQKITKEDGQVSLTDDPLILDRKFRALTPWPGIYFFLNRNGNDLRVIIKAAHWEDGKFIIDRVLPEGRKEIFWTDFEKNYRN